MKKVFSILTMFAVALATGFFSADKAEAIPAFARQMQMSCKSCHFQHFPKLNAFGRAFKANGYTDVAVDTINGDWGSSLPVNLNMSWVTKIRYLKNVDNDACNDCTGGAKGELQIVDEGVFFIGGRVAEHVGAAVEVAGGAWANGTIVFGHDLESLHTHLGLAVWSTDGAGPFWGKEIFNTGLIRGARGWENRDMTQSAALFYRADMNDSEGIAGGAATNSASGLTMYANHEWFFASLGAWAPGQGPGGAGANTVDVGVDFAGVYRFALTPPQIFGFDTMVGVYGVWGGSSYAGQAEQVDVEAHGIDFQAQGNVTDGISLEITGNFLYDTGNPGDRNMYGRTVNSNLRNNIRTQHASFAGTTIYGQDQRAYQVGFDLGFLSDRLISKFNYLHRSAVPYALGVGTRQDVLGASVDNRASVDILSLGAYYNIRENVSLRPEISWVVGGDGFRDRAGSGNNSGIDAVHLGNDTEFILMLMYAF